MTRASGRACGAVYGAGHTHTHTHDTLVRGAQTRARAARLVCAARAESVAPLARLVGERTIAKRSAEAREEACVWVYTPYSRRRSVVRESIVVNLFAVPVVCRFNERFAKSRETARQCARRATRAPRPASAARSGSVAPRPPASRHARRNHVHGTTNAALGHWTLGAHASRRARAVDVRDSNRSRRCCLGLYVPCSGASQPKLAGRCHVALEVKLPDDADGPGQPMP